jgi:hypothetical protein
MKHKSHYLIEYGRLPNKGTVKRKELTITLQLTDEDNTTLGMRISLSFSKKENLDTFLFVLNKAKKSFISLTLKEIYFIYHMNETDLQRL